MPFTKSRPIAIALLAVGALLLLATSYWLWNAQQLGSPTTIVGATLNLAPGAFLLVAGVTILAKPLRPVVAFWLAPLWAPVLLWVWAAFDGVQYPGVIGVMAAFFAYIGMLVVGLPGFAFLRVRNWNGLVATTGAGVAMGLAISYFGRLLLVLASDLGAAHWSALQIAFAPTIVLGSAVLGGLVGATFWAIVRPDRSAGASLDVFS
jgi:hypothetical protein